MTDTASDAGSEHDRDPDEPLIGRLERFIEAWEACVQTQAPVPELAEFLDVDGSIRLQLLVELIKVDLEYRWQHGCDPRRLTEYLDQFPELENAGIETDLIYEEVHIRRSAGDEVDVAEYLERFPERESELLGLLGEQNPFGTTRSDTGPDRSELDRIAPGDSIDDFDLLSALGEGTFAKVFLAHQRSMNRLVALKVSLDAGREHQTLAQFDHDYIVRVYDQRVEPERGLRLLYMQYHPGGTLHDLVRHVRETPPAERTSDLLRKTISEALGQRGEEFESGSLTIELPLLETWSEVVCWLGACLARGLHHAHQRRTLHRDVKPANVLLSRAGVPKLADFNISFSERLTGAAPAAYFGGSLAYMSPEQLEACHPGHSRTAESLDARSDLYSLGVVLWELLTGDRPFQDDGHSGSWSRTIGQMLMQRSKGISAEALQCVPADCPAALVDVLRKCLDPDPDRRWTSGSELARQLHACRDRRLQSILKPGSKHWSTRIAAHAELWIVLAAAIPNVLAGIFNLAYNEREIVSQLGPAERAAFWRIQAVINAIAYPVGLGVLWWLARGVRRAADAVSRPDAVARSAVVVQNLSDSSESGLARSDSRAVAVLPTGPALKAARTRWRCLNLGHLAALIGLAEWTLAGFIYPVAIHVVAGGMPTRSYAHFWASLVLCGLVAAAYPYFCVTTISLRSIYSRMVYDVLVVSEDRADLERLVRRSWGYLVSAVLVPLLAVLVLVSAESPSRFALTLLSSGSLLGFGLVFRGFRGLQEDAQVLLQSAERLRTRRRRT